MWLTGYPDFSIEKPILALYNPDVLKKQQESKEWYGELKLNIKRGFITKDHKNKIAFYSYLSDKPLKNLSLLLNRLKQMDIPSKTILEGGIYMSDDTPKFFIFDILVYEGRKLNSTCLQRRKLLEVLIKTNDLILRPVYSDFWLREFDLMLEKNSSLVKRAALNYGIPYEKLLQDVEGLVIKNKKSCLTFPTTVNFSPSYFKLRLDLVKKYIRS